MPADFELPPSPGGLGTSYNDTITGGVGNDTIDGGAGIDTAVYSGVRANYTISWIAGGVTVTSTTDGLDTIKNVEFVEFSDQTVTDRRIGSIP